MSYIVSKIHILRHIRKCIFNSYDRYSIHCILWCRCDSYVGCILLHSMSGGTGSGMVLNSCINLINTCFMSWISVLTHWLKLHICYLGLGSRICQAIREEYPMNYILSAGVSPHRSGESPLQCYNSMLSLSYLQK